MTKSSTVLQLARLEARIYDLGGRVPAPWAHIGGNAALRNLQLLEYVEALEKADRIKKIEALTMADVEAAKARAITARETRAGLSTVDYVLSQVGGTRTLESAKRNLIMKVG